MAGCSVKMFFGERLTAQGFEVYLSDPEQVFIADYDCTMICEALGIANNFTSFELTEKELLATASYQTWCMYVGEAGTGQLTFGYKVMDALGFDMAKLRDNVADFLTNFAENRTAQSVNEHMNQLVRDNRKEIMPKLQEAFNWLKNIHDKYYGREYLIQVGDQNAGICIKDKFGNKPAFNLKAEPGGLYYTSDMPSSAGGWPNPGVNQILGLTIGPETLLFHESDNRIGPFVKIDERKDINKLDNTWEVELSSCSDEAFYTKANSLYLKSSTTEAIYQVDGKQYVRVNVSGPPRLRLQKDGQLCDQNLISQGAVAMITLFEGNTDNDRKQALKQTFCDDPQNETDGAPTNTSAFNVLKSHRPCVVPDHFILPMRSNLFVYGPWSFVSNPVGGTIYENNKELCPWKFTNGFDDGYVRMNQYGNLIAADGPRGLQKQEKGSVTVAALPSYNIGYMVGTNAATLTDININIGEGGYTTTYNFQTYTPKFGSPGRALADLWSKSYQSMSYINKFFKDQSLELQKLINSTDTALQDASTQSFQIPGTAGVVTQDAGGANTQGSGTSPGLILIGSFFMRDKETNASGGTECHDGSKGLERVCRPCKPYIPPPDLGAGSSASTGNILKNRPKLELEKGYTWEHVKKNTFKRHAISTLDLIFTPITTNQEGDDEYQLPRLAMYQDYECGIMEYGDKPVESEPGKPPNSKPRNEIPPFLLDSGLTYDLAVHQQYLNAVTSEAMLNNWDGRQNGSSKGFICNVISWGTDEDYKLTHLDEDEQKRQASENFRYNILKGPLSLQAWGYDTSGKPIPNAVDSAAATEQGQFRRKGLQDKFLKNWLENPKTWPAGPIDLRWDRERGVWVAPPANKIVVARLLGNLAKYGVVEAELINPDGGGVSFYEYYDIWDKDGKNIKKSIEKAKIKIYDYLGIELCKCDTVYAYYDDNRYIVLESSRAYKDPNEACCPTTTAATPAVSQPTIPTPTSCWCNLECLQTLKGYKEGKHQALVHKSETQGPDCLMWEDIVECYTPPPNFYENQ